jgi:choline-phosphate cytidylyltransferase
MTKSNKIVYTYGVFDLLHIGHIKSLQQARLLGDKLVVGVFTDEVAESFKRKPAIPELLRMLTIQELGIADLVIFQNTLSPEPNAIGEGAHIIAKGPGAGFEDMHFGNQDKVLLEYSPLASTTKIIDWVKTKC